MSLTIRRQARVDTQHRISLRHAGFRPGTLVSVVATAQRAPARGKRPDAYSLFDQLQTLAGKLDRQWSRNPVQHAATNPPADYSLNFEQSLYPQRG